MFEGELVLVALVNTAHPSDELWINDVPADSHFIACKFNMLQNSEQVVQIGAIVLVPLDDSLDIFIALSQSH